MTRPPSTAHGRTRCPGCGHRFTDDARPTATIPGSEPAASRSRWYKAGRADQRDPVDIRWHTDCLADERARNAAYREQVRLDRRAEVEAIARGAGLDVDAVLADFDRTNPREEDR